MSLLAITLGYEHLENTGVGLGGISSQVLRSPCALPKSGLNTFLVPAQSPFPPFTATLSHLSAP